MHPLIEAAYYGNLQRLESLLADKEFHPSQIDDNEVLHLTVSKGYTKCLQRLIEAGAAVDKINSKGSTPLIEAVINNHVDCAIALIDADADVDLMNRYGGKTPVHIAAHKMQRCVFDVLLNAKADVNLSRDYKGKTPLHSAACTYEEYYVSRLIDAGAEVNKRDEKGETALYKTAKWGCTISTSAPLIAAGADPKLAKISTGDTPLHCIIEKINIKEEDRERAVELLVMGGADIFQSNKQGRSPMSLAPQALQVKLFRAKCFYQETVPDFCTAALAHIKQADKIKTQAWVRDKGSLALSIYKPRRYKA